MYTVYSFLAGLILTACFLLLTGRLLVKVWYAVWDTFILFLLWNGLFFGEILRFAIILNDSKVSDSGTGGLCNRYLTLLVESTYVIEGSINISRSRFTSSSFARLFSILFIAYLYKRAPAATGDPSRTVSPCSSEMFSMLPCAYNILIVPGHILLSFWSILDKFDWLF